VGRGVARIALMALESSLAVGQSHHDHGGTRVRCAPPRRLSTRSACSQRLGLRQGPRRAAGYGTTRMYAAQTAHARPKSSRHACSRYAPLPFKQDGPWFQQTAL